MYTDTNTLALGRRICEVGYTGISQFMASQEIHAYKKDTEDATYFVFMYKVEYVKLYSKKDLRDIERACLMEYETQPKNPHFLHVVIDDNYNPNTYEYMSRNVVLVSNNEIRNTIRMTKIEKAYTDVVDAIRLYQTLERKEREYRKYAKETMIDENHFPWFTLVIVAMMVVCLPFGCMNREGWAMTEHALADWEWYRLISYMFAHSGFMHLIESAVVVGIVMRKLEKNMGAKYIAYIYFIGGIMAGMGSAQFHREISLVGAGGAIFAILGAYIAWGIRKRNKTKGYIIFTAVELVMGVLSPGVDSICNVVGLMAGVVTCITIMSIDDIKIKKKYNAARLFLAQHGVETADLYIMMR